MLDSDYQYLQHYGGIHTNCLNKVLHHSDDENFDNDSLQIMKTSSYYDTDNFKSLLNTKTNNFGILSTNIQSVNAKLNEIEVFTQKTADTKLCFQCYM